MKILVTGASGFISANLVRFLIKENHEVGLLFRKESNLWRIKDILSQTTPFYSDLLDKQKLARVIKSWRPDMIYHLAVYGAYPKTQRDIRRMIMTNIIGSTNLMEVSEGIPLINTGSSSEYGIKDKIMKENDICQPDNYYGWSKLGQTLYFQLKRAVTLRLFSVYGPWEKPTRLIPLLIKSKMKHLPVKLINSVRDYIYIVDVIKAFMKASEKYETLKGEIINIGTGQQKSVRQLLDLLSRVDSTPLKISWDYVPVQAEPKKWCADIVKARKILGRSTQYDLERGIKETYEWWKEYLD